jgi:hypothetical protein
MGCEVVDEIHLAKKMEPVSGSFEYCNEPSGPIELKNSYTCWATIRSLKSVCLFVG